MQASASLKVTKSPTEYLNVFGVAYRYLRYLGVRRRIKSTTTQQYGRLANHELPQGELEVRADRERRQTFLRWLQDPDKVMYDDTVARAWKNYIEKRQAVHDERGRIAQFIFGEPKKNYDDARSILIRTVGMYLYNRWKSESVGNFRVLSGYLDRYQDTQCLMQVSEIADPRALLDAIRNDDQIGSILRDRFTHEGKKLLGAQQLHDKSESFLRGQLVA